MKDRIIKKLRRTFFDTRELQAGTHLSPLLSGPAFLPYTSSSLSLHALHAITNDVIVNSRTRIVEFGSGISTLLVARLLHRHQLDATLISIEENSGWMEVVKKALESEGIATKVQFIHAPVVPHPSVPMCHCYDPACVQKALSGISIDCVIIDGPSSWQKEFINSRVGVWELIDHHLASSSAVFVDNADRSGEKILLEKISKQRKGKPIHINSGFVAWLEGSYYNFYL